MAKWYDSSGKSSTVANAKYAVVEKGDTLWDIAKAKLGSGSKYTQLAEWNKISNPNKISIGKKIYFSKSTASSSTSSSSTTKKSTTKVTIEDFGLLASDDRKLYVTWSWGNCKRTESFKGYWQYYTEDGVWFSGSEVNNTVDSDYYAPSMQSEYSIPDGALKVRFRVKPVSKTYKVKSGNTEKEKTHFTGEFCSWKTHTVSNPLESPSTPSDIEIDDNNKLTVAYKGLDIYATHIQFQIIQNDTTSYKKSEELKINSYGNVSWSYKVAAGNNYTVRARAIKGKLTSEWSIPSSSYQSIPSAPSKITTCKASDKTDGTDGKYTVYLEWKSVKSADTYDIEYANHTSDFDAANGQTTKVSTEDSTTSISITNLDPGEYFFRVRATNERGSSNWTDTVSVKMGDAPDVPTTWESSTRVIIGEPLSLYWAHNATDGSTQSKAELCISTDGGNTYTMYKIPNDAYYGLNAGGVVYVVKAFEDNSDKDKTSVFQIDTNFYGSDTTLTWWVATAGLVDAVGKTSTPREIDIYESPSLDLLVTDEYEISESGEVTLLEPDGGTMGTLEAFPFYIKAIPSNVGQTPIGYSLSITSNGSYETVDEFGNTRSISIGDEVYSKYFDISSELVVEMSAGNIDLENGVEYTIHCTVAMNSGLTADVEATFDVSWSDEQYTPNAEIAIDYSTYTASIRPYCEDIQFVYHMVDDYVVQEDTVEEIDSVYTTTDEKVYIGQYKGSPIYYCIAYVDSQGTPYDIPRYYKVNRASGSDEFVTSSTRLTNTAITTIYTNTGEAVLLGTHNDLIFEYCEVQKSTIIEDVTLSVYRREFDGGFTEIATDIDNTKNTFVTDPHPPLDYARYRIVARSNSTGAINFYDVPGHPVGCTSIIIQWDEEWSSFDNWTEDLQVEPPWTGSLLELPYNIDESDSVNPDVTMVKYIGRKRPVTYYGTQLGETTSWSTTVDKNDTETLYALRRLSIWTGDVYVRSPSGTGYWAHVKPSYSLKHCDVTIPVTLEITRVEGGI